MTFMQHPRLVCPPPLRGSEVGSFAHMTVTERLPAIARRAMAENHFSESIAADLEDLANDVRQGSIRQLGDDGGSDVAAWGRYVQPFLGERWIAVPWYVAETFFYRRLLEATQYFRPGSWQGVDPYRYQKQTGLTIALEAVETLSAQVNTWIKTAVDESGSGWDQSMFSTLAYAALWGNRADMSLWPIGAGEHDRRRSATGNTTDHILVDDTLRLANYVASLQAARIDIIADNAGFELVCDLALVDFLLTSRRAATIWLHLKAHPTFVSDAMINDVQQALALLAAHPSDDVRALVSRLQHHLASGRMRLRHDLFWTAPLSFWELPEHLSHELAQSQLVFVKGDANYRRLLGDRQWPFSTPFEDIVGYFPAPLAALRTLKAELAAGLDSSLITAVSAQDRQWLTNGRWGVIQFVNP